MMPLLAATAAVFLIGGALLIVLGLQPVPDTGRPPRRPRPRPIATLLGDHLPPIRRRTHRTVLVCSAAAGVVLWVLTGWALAVVVVPAAVLGLPTLLRTPAAGTSVDRLTGLEQWTRGLSGVLTVGTGIEHAILASLSSTPASIHPQVADLAARINARLPTAEALRRFADDLDDATGDLVVASLILGSSRRGPGLAAVLDDLAVSVAEDVRMRRAIEADRAKPRNTARWVAVLFTAALILLSIQGTYLQPYRSPGGQIALLVLLALYVLCLWWMRQLSTGRPTPRFLPETDPGATPGRTATASADTYALTTTTRPAWTTETTR
ncbi:MAG: hypothetical protein QOD63_1092 [Actinomycetota bacterium]|jgi:Flp pilus assembly protein TadB|nr:hypothetical protein [Actinomycetota bacterium]